MGLNPDASQLLDVSFAQPREGSCLTPELLAELAGLIRIKLPTTGSAGASCVSKSSDNIATLDAENCILVPAAVLYTEEQTFDASSAADLIFDGFAEQGIDATTCFFGCFLLLDSTEAGKDAMGDPSGTVNVRPNYEIKALTASSITITVKNADSDVVVRIQLLQLPVPPEQP